MAFPTLRDFLDHLEKHNELARVKVPADPVLEITEIADRVMKSPAPHGPSERDKHAAAKLGGKALLFERPVGSDIPIAINTFGSYWRVCQALGCNSLDDLADRVQQLIKPEMPTSLIEKMKKGMDLIKLASFPPKSVRSGICQQIVLEGEKADPTKLPVLQCWPLDGDLRSDQVFDRKASLEAADRQTGTGRYFTLGGIYTRHPETGARNVGMYRVQIHGPRTCAMHWHMHHDGARHFRAYKARNERMPLAIVLGGESVLPYSATAPLPPGVEELLFAGFLNNRGIELVPCKTIDLEVPANAEIVIEGFVSNEAGSIGFDPRVEAARLGGPLSAEALQRLLGPGAVFEGPFGDHTGFYSMPDRYPIFEVTAITHRRRPIYPTTIVGLPPQEDYYLGKATERLFLPLLRTIVPDILDYDLPMFVVFHSCAFVRIRKEYPLHARRVMHAIWGAGQMAWTKAIVVVDEDVDVHDQDAVLFHLAANVDPGRDIEIVNGPLDILDHAAPRLGAGHKIGFDATRKIPGEEVGGHAVRPWPPLISMSEGVKTRVSKRWGEFGLGR